MKSRQRPTRHIAFLINSSVFHDAKFYSHWMDRLSQCNPQTNKSTDKLTDSPTDRQTDRQTNKSTDRQVDERVGKQTDKPTNKSRWTDCQADRWMDRGQTDAWADARASKWVGGGGGWTDRHIQRQTDRQASRGTDRPTCGGRVSWEQRYISSESLGRDLCTADCWQGLKCPTMMPEAPDCLGWTAICPCLLVTQSESENLPITTGCLGWTEICPGLLVTQSESENLPITTGCLGWTEICPGLLVTQSESKNLHNNNRLSRVDCWWHNLKVRTSTITTGCLGWTAICPGLLVTQSESKNLHNNNRQSRMDWDMPLSIGDSVNLKVRTSDNNWLSKMDSNNYASVYRSRNKSKVLHTILSRRKNVKQTEMKCPWIPKMT